MLRIRAGVIHPITAPPFDDGAVLVGANGRIAALGPDADVPAPAGCRTIEFPGAHLIPGLVNCHTHLELTHLAGRHEAEDFVAWIRGVRALKDATSLDEFIASAETGLRDCWEHGVTCVADTGSSGVVLDVLRRLGGRGIAYHEVFGPDPRLAQQCFADYERQIGDFSRRATGSAMLGVSPHAPYTVSAPLYRLVADLAQREGLPIAVHLAESTAETELVRDGAGPFADALRARGIEVHPTGLTPVQYLVELGVVAPQRCLCIHCVQMDDGDVAALAQSNAAIAHCPRSNLAHGHGRAPLAAFQTQGMCVGLGTDSIMSVGDLDLIAEARATGVDGPSALRALTLDGARALGLDQEIGSLEVGKWGDLAVLSSTIFTDLHHPSRATGAASRQRSTPSTVLAAVIGGRVIHPIDFDA